MAIPDLPEPRDAQLVEALSAAHPGLSEPHGWHVAFGRELNATDDRACWAIGGAEAPPRGTLPVIEGKHIDPFVVRLDRVTKHAAAAAVRTRISGATISRSRLAYREVAAATNRLTLIAAILPARTISVHTVFCLRTSLPLDEQDVLCALLNSFVANYLVRRWVTTHVTASIVARLPAPRPARGTHHFGELARLAARARAGDTSGDLMARLQATAARAYGVTGDDFAHIVRSFPLIPAGDREAAIRALSLEQPLKD
jgi:hypothetical protein